MSDTLFNVPVCLSPRLRRIAELSGALESAKTHFGILTHCSDACSEPWLAVLPPPGDKRSIGQLMADECETMEDEGRTAYGMTEIEAVATLIKRRYDEAPHFKLLVELMELEGLR